MTDTQHPGVTPIAIVGVGAVLPDAPDVDAFWDNLTNGRSAITDVPPERWDPELYYDPDHAVPDKTYSRIGGWVREFAWEPAAWKLPIPPKVAEQMDEGQRWAVACARAALLDAGWPDWNVDPERVAVVIGNAIGGEKHYATNMRIQYPEFARELTRSPSFETLPESVRVAILEETQKQFLSAYPEINEDTMPGELANIIAGRIANLFNFRGPNFTTDAACASGLAGLNSAVQGLVAGDYDAAVTGGVDRNMGVAAYVKFCKIGALSATGTRPFDAGADGFVMGEGASLFVLKRLADAERDGDRVYAVILGIAGSSDGKGKGITAPNPVGQQLAVRRAWAKAGLDPATATAVEAHGTSTRVGDAAELESLNKVFGEGSASVGAIALGSVKSNIGHLKAAAGTAGLLKVALSLHHKKLVPSINVTELNPNVDWATSPFRVNTELHDWPQPAGDVRRAGVSAFGFGGTNFHVVLEEHVPGRYRDDRSRSFAAADVPQTSTQSPAAALGKAPLRGALVVGGTSDSDVAAQLRTARDRAAEGTLPPAAPPDPALARAAVRVAIDYGDAKELVAKVDKAVTALTSGNAAMLKMLRSQGVFVGRGPAPKVAFLYTGQGSQYVNMLETLRAAEPVVAETFDEADRIMTPLLGRPLTSYIFDGHEPEAIAAMEQQLLQTEITQPAVLASDLALTRLLAAYGIEPDMVMGHSLGEYGALVAAGVMTFDTALEAVSARGHEMASLSVEDNGAMAAVMAPIEDIERIVGEVDGYVVVANVNSTRQAVIGGATVAVDKAVQAFTDAGFTAMRIPVSHAFHTSIVAPASVPLRAALKRLGVRPPQLPIVANVTGEFYPHDADEESILDMLSRQVASPVQFVRGLRTLYDAGARVFVEVGPKRALHGFTEDVLGAAHDDVVSLFTNHPKAGDIAAFNTALCGLYAAGLGFPSPVPSEPVRVTAPAVPEPTATATAAAPTTTVSRPSMSTDRYAELGHLFVDFLEKGREVFAAGAPQATNGVPAPTAEPVVVSGAALGLPSDHVFADDNVARILAGQQFIDLLPRELRRDMVDRHITRLVKSETGDPTFQTIDSENDVIRLAGRHGDWSVVDEFGVDADRDKALDTCTRLAIGAGFDALRDAGIPLVQHYKTTSLGTKLPDRWGLPEELRDSTGVVFASAFPGYDSFARDLNAFWEDRSRREQLAGLREVRSRMVAEDPAVVEVDRRIGELEHTIATEPFVFDRRFLFKVLSMGHSQFAEIIGARGPNTQVNAACASTTQALTVAEDWIRAGRCQRVVVVSADDVTGDGFMPWAGSGFLASGAAATDDVVEEAALPFDRRRHGMIMGMGAAAIVVESADSVRERGLQPICEVLATVTANSAFHGTRLDVDHIGSVMDTLLERAGRYGVRAADIASRTVFVSHETYTPARGGSASAEINALRRVFGDAAGSVVVTNTKGFTGHAMGAGIEDVVAVKALETGIVPPVANYRDPDPDLGPLTLSRGGAYPVDHALRLAAGFGSQVAMALLRWTPLPDGRRRSPAELGYAYRIVDPARWQAWLDRAAGHPGATLEVKQRRLRLVDTGAPAAATAPAPVVAAAPAAATAPVAVVAAAVPPGGPSLAPLGRPESAELAPAPPATMTDPVEEAVISVVEQMTGYGRELLDLDLDLEADLGVDTVKQAEVFAAVREHYGVERDDKLQLRDFPTLRHVA
ncbi:MAG TPA: beta-ketoacyl synthase N-terminal-like domain-containing protein, partial [Mycobacteriales bacterium]|nr:beta-ketoacyl synthase N-terminal-like domain-containing protein [Mycobacteriales bacterium]